jgi:hypothetical protein
LSVRATVRLASIIPTVTEFAVADAMTPRARSGVPVAASADDAASAEAAIARPRMRFSDADSAAGAAAGPVASVAAPAVRRMPRLCRALHRSVIDFMVGLLTYMPV